MRTQTEPKLGFSGRGLDRKWGIRARFEPGFEGSGTTGGHIYRSRLPPASRACCTTDRTNSVFPRVYASRSNSNFSLTGFLIRHTSLPSPGEW